MSHVNTRALLPGGDVKHIKNKIKCHCLELAGRLGSPYCSQSVLLREASRLCGCGSTQLL